MCVTRPVEGIARGQDLGVAPEVDHHPSADLDRYLRAVDAAKNSAHENGDCRGSPASPCGSSASAPTVTASTAAGSGVAHAASTSNASRRDLLRLAKTDSTESASSSPATIFL